MFLKIFAEPTESYQQEIINFFVYVLRYPLEAVLELILDGFGSRFWSILNFAFRSKMEANIEGQKNLKT